MVGIPKASLTSFESTSSEVVRQLCHPLRPKSCLWRARTPRAAAVPRPWLLSSSLSACVIQPCSQPRLSRAGTVVVHASCWRQLLSNRSCWWPSVPCHTRNGCADANAASFQCIHGRHLLHKSPTSHGRAACNLWVRAESPHCTCRHVTLCARAHEQVLRA